MATARRPAAPLDAFVLHRYDWSETSLILDLFTRSRGRIAVAAKGAKRPYSQLRSVLLPFQRIAATVGRQADEAQAEVLTLRSAEWAGIDACPVLPAPRLFAGFYLNELLMKLLARGDAHPALFDAYSASLCTLASLVGPGNGVRPAPAGGRRATAADDVGEQIALRAFELVLLREIGLLPELGMETASHRPVRADRRYLVLADAGVVETETETENEATVSGATLAALEMALAADLESVQRVAAGVLAELRPLLRAQLHYHLGTSQLRTRQVMIEAQALDR